MPRWRDCAICTVPLTVSIILIHWSPLYRNAIAGGLKLHEQQFVRVLQAPHADQDQRIRPLGVHSRDLTRHQLPRELVGFATWLGGQFDRRAIGGAQPRYSAPGRRVPRRRFCRSRPGQHQNGGEAAQGGVNDGLHAEVTSDGV